MACKFLKLKHHLHSPSLEKSLIERTIQYIKDRTKECFDDYFPCKLKNCKLKHVRNWMNLFVHYHNVELKMLNWTEPMFLYIFSELLAIKDIYFIGLILCFHLYGHLHVLGWIKSKNVEMLILVVTIIISLEWIKASFYIFSLKDGKQENIIG